MDGGAFTGWLKGVFGSKAKRKGRWRESFSGVISQSVKCMLLTLSDFVYILEQLWSNGTLMGSEGPGLSQENCRWQIFRRAKTSSDHAHTCTTVVFICNYIPVV